MSFFNEVAEEDSMKARAFGLLFLGLVLTATILIQIQQPISNSQVPTAPVPEAAKQQVRDTYEKLPLYFIENQGQLDPASPTISRAATRASASRAAA